MSLDEWLDSEAAKHAGVTLELLEKLAAAYSLLTHLAPDECELVEQHRSDGTITYHFRKRSLDVSSLADETGKEGKR